MTNPVSADIEKEVALLLDGIDIALNDASFVEAIRLVATLRAALLAEAAERKRLEAERGQLQDVFEIFQVTGAIGLKDNVERLIARQTQLRTDLAAAELRASTEAERARGLEAQLETVKSAATGISHTEWCKAGREARLSCVCGLAELLAALSQLPTPQKG